MPPSKRASNADYATCSTSQGPCRLATRPTKANVLGLYDVSWRNQKIGFEPDLAICSHWLLAQSADRHAMSDAFGLASETERALFGKQMELATMHDAGAETEQHSSTILGRQYACCNHVASWHCLTTCFHMSRHPL